PRDSTGGPLFIRAPKSVRICIFRTLPNRFALGHFIGGFRLDESRTRRLLGALTGAGPRRGCAKQRTFAVVIRSHGSVASVELEAAGGSTGPIAWPAPRSRRWSERSSADARRSRARGSTRPRCCRRRRRRAR